MYSDAARDSAHSKTVHRICENTSRFDRRFLQPSLFVGLHYLQNFIARVSAPFTFHLQTLFMLSFYMNSCTLTRLFYRLIIVFADYRPKVTLSSRLSIIIADVLVIAVTWHRTFRHVREATRLGIRTSISSVMLKDGTFTHHLHEIDSQSSCFSNPALTGSLYFAYATSQTSGPVQN